MCLYVHIYTYVVSQFHGDYYGGKMALQGRGPSTPDYKMCAGTGMGGHDMPKAYLTSALQSIFWVTV